MEVYKRKDGEPIATHYWINVCNRIDSVDHAKTTYVKKTDYGGQHWFWTKSGVENPEMAFSVEKTAPFHLWRDPHIVSALSFFCSDAFAQAALQADFSGLGLTPQ